jgi:hypothetical protein
MARLVKPMLSNHDDVPLVAEYSQGSNHSQLDTWLWIEGQLD